LLPGLLKDSLHEPSPAVAGAVVFELFLFAAAGAAVTSSWMSLTAMRTGLVLLTPSLALLVAAQMAGSMVLLVAATALAGLAAAFGYRGSLEVVNQIAPDEQRAEVVSSYLIAVFLGNSLPVIGIGLSSDVLGPLAAQIGFAALIGVITMAALGIGSKYTPLT
jgi:hypothetical protein